MIEALASAHSLIGREIEGKVLVKPSSLNSSSNFSLETIMSRRTRIIEKVNVGARSCICYK